MYKFIAILRENVQLIFPLWELFKKITPGTLFWLLTILVDQFLLCGRNFGKLGQWARKGVGGGGGFPLSKKKK